MNALVTHVLRDHVILGGGAAICLLPLFGWQWSFAFWLANILVDLDHYLNFLWRCRFRAIGIKAMFRFHAEVFQQTHRPDFLGLEPFHTLEFLCLLGLLGFLSLPSLIPIFSGILFHVLVDLVHLSRYGILSKRAHSFTEYFWRRHRMVFRGHNPDGLFDEALEAMGKGTPT